MLVTFGLSIKIMADTAVVQSSTSSIDHHTVASLTGRVISSRNASQKTKLMVQYSDGRGYSGARNRRAARRNTTNPGVVAACYGPQSVMPLAFLYTIGQD